MAEHVYEVSIGWVASNKNFGMNLFRFQLDDAGFTTPWSAAQSLAHAFVTTIVPVIVPLLGTDVTINLCSARRITGGGGVSATQVVNAAGTGGGPTVSSAVAACVKWIVGDPDNKTGRNFIGGIDGTVLSGDVFTNGFNVLVNGLVAQLLVPLAVGAVNAIFGKWDKKLATFWPALAGQLNPKASGFNKRTLPVT